MKESQEAIIRELMEESTLFKFLEEEDMEKIVPYFEKKRIPAEETIYREGDSPDFLALILNGRVDVKKETSFKGKHIILAQMSEGALLGEIGIFDENPRSASVEAVDDTDLLLLSREKLDAFIAAHPDVGVKILRGVSRILSLRLRDMAERLVLIF